MGLNQEKKVENLMKISFQKRNKLFPQIMGGNLKVSIIIRLGKIYNLKLKEQTLILIYFNNIFLISFLYSKFLLMC